MWHASVAYYLPVLFARYHLKSIDQLHLSAFVLLILFVVVHLKLLLIWHHKNIASLLSVVFSIVSFGVLAIVYDQLIA